MPVHHVSLPTTPSTHAAMRAFYLATLQPLGYGVFKEKAGVFLGLHTNMNPDFWLHCCSSGSAEHPVIDEEGHPPSGEQVQKKEKGGDVLVENGEKQAHAGTHVAFEVGSRREVEVWYENAV